MKQSVRVRIESRQEGGSHTGTASGVLYRKGGACYLRYEETDETLGSSTTTVRWDDNEIRVIRRGSIESEQTFRPGKSTQGVYALPQGRALLECRTKQMKQEQHGSTATLSWSYDLYIDGMHAGLFGLKLVIEEDRSR